jgi:cardiolipin synthase
MWNAVSNKDVDDHDFKRWLPDVAPVTGAEGFVLPYADSPLDSEQVGEDVYISVAEYAKDYAWYITPYLILTDEMVHALGLAAKRGVDVRIVTPGIPDKKTVFRLTRANYEALLKGGVRIYEYTPGFLHAKSVLLDDAAVVGTINFDFRSLYHHFENAVYFTTPSAVAALEKDFAEIVSVSKEQTLSKRKTGVFSRLFNSALRLIEPLL